MAKTSKGFGRINNELELIAAITRSLTAEELQRLNELVDETGAIAAEDNSKMFRRLQQRAKLIRRSQTPPPKRAPRNRQAFAPSSPPDSSAAPVSTWRGGRCSAAFRLRGGATESGGITATLG